MLCLIVSCDGRESKADLPSLTSIELGSDVFRGCEGKTNKLKLRGGFEISESQTDLPSLTRMIGRVRALQYVKEVEAVNLPALSDCQFISEFEKVEKVKMHNAGEFSRLNPLKEVQERTNMVRCKKDWNSLSDGVGVIVIASASCNEAELTVVDFSVFTCLRELHVGNECFENVMEVRIVGLTELLSVRIGEKSFSKKKDWYTKSPHRCFYLKDCDNVKELIIGFYSFSDYMVCVIENVPSLEVISMGDLVKEHKSWCFLFASLELKSCGGFRRSSIDLPSLKYLLFGRDAFYNCNRLVLESGSDAAFSHADLPELLSIQLGLSAFAFFNSGEDSTLILRSGGGRGGE